MNNFNKRLTEGWKYETPFIASIKTEPTMLLVLSNGDIEDFNTPGLVDPNDFENF